MEDREKLIQEIIERMLRILPEVVGNLMTAHATNARLSEEFYKSYPEFKSHKDIVRESIAKIDLENPSMGYEDILKKAIPSIREGIKAKGGVSMIRPSERPPIDLNGEL